MYLVTCQASRMYLVTCQASRMDLVTCQASRMELFSENSKRLKAGDCFCIKCSIIDLSHRPKLTPEKNLGNALSGFFLFEIQIHLLGMSSTETGISKYSKYH